MKNEKQFVILLTICLCILTGCSSAKETIPDTVRKEAEAWAAETLENYQKASYQYNFNFNFSDWRITRMEHCYTYEELEGMKLDVFRIDFEFLSDTPESVILIGGMSTTGDGWFVPDYADSRYLVYQQDGESLVLVTRMAENDCEPGDETFTSDLIRSIREIELKNLLKEYPAI